MRTSPGFRLALAAIRPTRRSATSGRLTYGPRANRRRFLWE